MIFIDYEVFFIIYSLILTEREPNTFFKLASFLEAQKNSLIKQQEITQILIHFYLFIWNCSITSFAFSRRS